MKKNLTIFFVVCMMMLNKNSFAIHHKLPETKNLPSTVTVAIQAGFVMNTTCLETAQLQQSIMYTYSNQQFNVCINGGGAPSGCYTAQRNFENASTAWIISQLNYCEGFREI